MRRVRLAALAALGTAFSCCPGAASAEPADALVFDAISAPASVSFEGLVEDVRLGRSGAVVSIYRIEHRAPDATERTFTAPAAERGQELITRGKDTYAVDPAARRIVESANAAADDQVAFDDNYILLRANYRAAVRGSESFDGRQCDVVALNNKYTNHTTMLLRIDRQTKLVLEKQQFASDGSMVSEVRFESVRFEGAPPDSDFALPAGFVHVAGPSFGVPDDNVTNLIASAGFSARGPKFLPDGFSPVEGKVATVKGVRTLHLLYSDGIRTISLFENPSPTGLDMQRFHSEPTTVSGRDAQYAETGPTTLLTWNDTALHYVLVGDLSLEELQRIAASI
ncbi:MAG TPA: outer membrane lipoprotein-sorting protein [Candidatus Acidoferrales bacterium]|nr:outer membrane lipoprotein-sorting protein [Candidatus Acidoferrales bacterium]